MGIRQLLGLGTALALGITSLAVPGLAKAGAAEPSKPSEGAPKLPPLAVEKLGELISTNGQGQVTLLPDSMKANIGVEVQGKTLESARREQARKLQAILKAIEGLGLTNLKIQTSQLQVFPVFEEKKEGEGPGRIVAYRAVNTLAVTLRGSAPEKLGEETAAIIDQGVKAGANLVQGVSFFLANPEPAQMLALKLAVEHTERSAKAMASAAGVKVKRLHSLEGSPGNGGSIFFTDAKVRRSEGTPVEPGEITISASVTAKYHFAKE